MAQMSGARPVHRLDLAYEAGLVPTPHATTGPLPHAACTLAAAPHAMYSVCQTNPVRHVHYTGWGQGQCTLHAA